jgi:hypothetical protein
MHVHNWKRVVAGIFHDFHFSWIHAIRDELNGGLLPENYYAMAEQVAGAPRPDVLALEEIPSDERPTRMPVDDLSGVALAEHPPQVRYTLEAEEAIYAQKKNRVAIHHASDDRVVSFIEIISPGKKHYDRVVVIYCG